jgi:hypothetical protein
MAAPVPKIMDTRGIWFYASLFSAQKFKWASASRPNRLCPSESALLHGHYEDELDP